MISVHEKKCSKEHLNIPYHANIQTNAEKSNYLRLIPKLHTKSYI